MATTTSLDATAVPAPVDSGRRGSALSALALGFGAVGLGVLNLLSPWASSTDQVATLRADAGLLTWLSVLWFCSSALLVGGITGVVVRVQGRGRTLALTGGVLAAAASISSAAIGALEGVGPALAGAIGDDEALAVAMKAFETSPVLFVVFPLWLLGSVIGWPLLFGGAARFGLVSAWLVLPVAIAWVGNVVPTTSTVVTALLVCAFVVPAIVLAWRLVSPPSNRAPRRW